MPTRQDLALQLLPASHCHLLPGCRKNLIEAGHGTQTRPAQMGNCSCWEQYPLIYQLLLAKPVIKQSSLSSTHRAEYH